MDDFALAEQELKDALGIKNTPKWTQARLTREEASKCRQWRYKAHKGCWSKKDRDRAIKAIKERSRTDYYEANPRYPPRWRMCVNRYFALRSRILEQGGLTSGGANLIVDYVSAKEVAKRKADKEKKRRLRKMRKIARAINANYRRVWVPEQMSLHVGVDVPLCVDLEEGGFDLEI